MSEERQKNQEQLAFPFAGGSEAPLGEREGAEAPRVRRETEDPAGNQRVMEEVCERENRREAMKRVRANQGSPGIDGMTVDELPEHLGQHWPAIREQLLSGTYEPKPVKRVEIPKPDGGVRKLGIPTVLDRFVQQAVQQVLQKQWDPTSGTDLQTDFPNTATVFDRSGRPTRRWHRRSSISPQATAGALISI